MESDEKNLLEKTLEVSEENNKILKEMERSARWGRIFSIVRIVLFLLPFILGFLYLMPFVRKMNEFYSVFGSSDSSGTSTDALTDFWSELKRSF